MRNKNKLITRVLAVAKEFVRADDEHYFLFERRPGGSGAAESRAKCEQIHEELIELIDAIVEQYGAAGIDVVRDAANKCTDSPVIRDTVLHAVRVSQRRFLNREASDAEPTLPDYLEKIPSYQRFHRGDQAQNKPQSRKGN